MLHAADSTVRQISWLEVLYLSVFVWLLHTSTIGTLYLCHVEIKQVV